MRYAVWYRTRTGLQRRDYSSELVVDEASALAHVTRNARVFNSTLRAQEQPLRPVRIRLLDRWKAAHYES